MNILYKSRMIKVMGSTTRGDEVGQARSQTGSKGGRPTQTHGRSTLNCGGDTNSTRSVAWRFLVGRPRVGCSARQVSLPRLPFQPRHHLKIRIKWNKTRKNMKQISIESWRVDLGNSLDKIHFYTLLPICKIATTQILRYLIAKLYKDLSIKTLQKCTLHAQ
jgi:hypothetical protein